MYSVTSSTKNTRQIPAKLFGGLPYISLFEPMVPSWDVSLTAFLRTADTLDRLQAKEREMALLPVTLPGGKKLSLTAGGQNELVKKIIEEFCPRFTPGGVVAYLGDTGQKRRHVEAGYLERLGVEIDEHGKMPDVVVHLPERNWLVLGTSHGRRRCGSPRRHPTSFTSMESDSSDHMNDEPSVNSSMRRAACRIVADAKQGAGAFGRG
jgi:hypothetical protein